MSTPKRIYIAGPMTGLPYLNFPSFHVAAAKCRGAGWEAVNPADNFDGRTDLPRTSYLRADVALLVQCDAIALLPGWEKSRGAKLEYLLARELGLEVYDAQTLQLQEACPEVTVTVHSANGLGESLLEEAQRLTDGQRQGDYGHPREDFARSAQMWSGVLAAKLLPGAQVSAMDVPLCMIAVKLARQAHRHKRDNLVDIAGYARTAAMVAGCE